MERQRGGKRKVREHVTARMPRTREILLDLAPKGGEDTMPLGEWVRRRDEYTG